MPQIFQALRCYKCFVFQVHQMKKSNKFECKLCGEKQSIKRHYGVGSGKECRLHVQKLNGIRGNIEDLNNSLSTDDENCEDIKNTDQNKEDLVNEKNESKWAEYLDKTKIDSNETVNDDMYLNDTEVVLEVPSKRCKFTRNKSRASYKFKNNEEVFQRESIEDAIIERQSNDISDSSIKLQLETASTSKQTVRKKFIPPSCNKTSKWAHYIDETKNFHDETNADEDIEGENIISKDVFLDNKSQVADNKTSYSQRNLTMNNLSRCANTQSKKHHQFNPLSIRKNISKNQPQKLFSLCNDNDLDDILDI